MTKKYLPLLIIIPLFIGLFLIITSNVQAADDGPLTNEDCFACHDKPNQYFELSTGKELLISISPELYYQSAHYEQQCIECHTDITTYPHPEVEAPTIRDYIIQHEDSCLECHEEKYELVQDSIHQHLLDEGNLYAPVCSDCHDPHKDVSMYREDGTYNVIEKIRIPETCSSCHNGIYETYANSVHGNDLLQGGNFDTPTCIDCHGVHSVSDPKTPQFRASSIEICADCHTNEEMMNKYGISTDVMNTYIADFHGTTVTLFEKHHPDELTNKAVCYDCHGIHDIAKVDDPEHGIAIKQNLLTTCQKCHPDATINFPDSWMSHYSPNLEKYPLVYIIDLSYKILIPAVIGGMIIFVTSDFIRRQINRRKEHLNPATEGK